MIGDKLASGASSATFTGPRLKFEENQMRRDLKELPASAFMEKYLVTQREYDLMLDSDGQEANMLTKAVQDHLEAIERLTVQDKAQEESLKRKCPFKPFYRPDLTGRIISTRDQPKVSEAISKLALPRHLRQQKEVLPTTGYIIDIESDPPARDLIGTHIIFGPMSGQAMCFNGYPTFYILETSEILAVITDPKAQVVEQELEPLT